MLDKNTLTEVVPADSSAQTDINTYLDIGTQTDMKGTKQKVTQTDPDISDFLE